MNIRVTNNNITELNLNQIFVFGSNIAGRHGAGAARFAQVKFGAKYGFGDGLYGKSYAIPTKDENIETLSIERIKVYVDKFIEFAKANNYLTFLVTEIGCGLAGLTPKQIAPLFNEAIKLSNVHLPEAFWNIINENAKTKSSFVLKCVDDTCTSNGLTLNNIYISYDVDFVQNLDFIIDDNGDYKRYSPCFFEMCLI